MKSLAFLSDCGGRNVLSIMNESSIYVCMCMYVCVAGVPPSGLCLAVCVPAAVQEWRWAAGAGE